MKGKKKDTRKVKIEIRCIFGEDGETNFQHYFRAKWKKQQRGLD